MTTDFPKKMDDTLGSKVLVGLVNHILEHASFFGINREALLLQGGLTEEQLGDSNQCIPLSHFEKIIAYIYSYSSQKDPLIALSFFQKMDSTAYGVLGHLVPLASSLNHAIETLKEFQPLIGCIGEISLQVEPEVVYWKWKCRSNDPLFTRCANEYNLSWWLSLIRLVRNEDFAILKAVHFTHSLAKPDLQNYYDEFFGCPVHFDQKETALLLLPKSLNMSLKTGNAGLYDSVRLFASKLLEQQRVEQTFVQQVRAQIYLLLHHNRLSRENVAGQFGVNVRTLSRKLHQENSSYSQLLDQVRLELAVNYLESYQHSVVFISKALGFYTSHSFISWFKLQTNLTPIQYRKNTNNQAING
ncbi:AraC family transcriptional regulator [Acinetobacter halotolerans]|uniref:AraC family transcriptional regulator n=1 Tax=Acinetobacter halotolerans TaxID=1752076 RepID=A0A4Q6X7Y5_9GAMM|nr:AraC family transcriptional regulator [Acinetobacter halotolerans]RZF49557.1 AraC family transcriptional regulator [Acinetobacter halotolerans]